MHSSADSAGAAEMFSLIFRACQAGFCLLEMDWGLWSADMGQLQKTCTALLWWKGWRGATDSWVWSVFQTNWCSDLVLQQKGINSVLQGPMSRCFCAVGPRGSDGSAQGCVLEGAGKPGRGWKGRKTSRKRQGKARREEEDVELGSGGPSSAILSISQPSLPASRGELELWASARETNLCVMNSKPGNARGEREPSALCHKQNGNPVFWPIIQFPTCI